MKLFTQSIVFFIAITAFAPFASGQNLYWDGNGVGDFNTAANWSTVPPNLLATSGTRSVPGPNNIAIVDIDLNNGTISNDFLTEATGTNVAISQTLQGNTVQGYIVSNVFLPGGTSSFINTSGQNFTITGTGSATGDFLVDGGAALTMTVGATVVTNGTIVVGDNANGFFEENSNDTIGGQGTLNIASGSLNYDAAGTATSMFVGYSSTALNSVNSGSAVGIVNQGSATTGGSTVTLGSSLVLGYNGGVGSWNVTSGSLLQTGTLASSYQINLGANGGPALTGNTGASGTLSVDGSSVFDFGTSGSAIATDLQLGTTTVGAAAGVSGGVGTINENGDINIAGSATTVEVGGFGRAGAMGIAAGSGGTGNFNLTEGTLNIGTGATDVVTFTLGAGTGSKGTLTEGDASISGGGNAILNVGAAGNGTTFNVGGAGTGAFTMTGGTANFFVPITVAARGTVNLNGGTLNIAAENFAATGNNVGSLNFGGGTLKFTNTAATTYTDNFGGGVLSGTTSTIDASAATNLVTVSFAYGLSGTGGISLIGNGPTTFNFASATGGAANTYSGSTSILNGTLNATVDDFGAGGTNSLVIGATGAPAVLNLGVRQSATTLGQAISGNGTLNVNFDAANENLILSNTTSALSTVNIVLGANTGPVGIASATTGTLTVFSGAFGNISGVGSGVDVGMGGMGAGPGTVTFGAATYTGPTTIFLNYTLNATSMTSSVNNAGTLNVTGAAGLTGNITANTGLVNVLGASGITGDVTSNQGVINVSSITGNIISNGATGTINASSPLMTVTGTVMNTGTLTSTAPLVGITGTPTFSVGGALTSPGTLVIRTNGTTADDFHSGGVVDLDGGTLKINVVGGGKIGTTMYQIADGTNVSDMNTVLSPNTALFSYTLTNNGTALELNVTQSPISTFAQTPNQAAVANAIDGTNSPLFTLFGNIPAGAAASSIPGLLDQLSPESLQYARNIAFEQANLLAVRMNGVDADLRAGYGGLDSNAVSITSPGFGSGLGRSLGNLLASNDPSFHEAAPNGVNYYPGGPGGAAIDGSSGGTSLSPHHASEATPAAAPPWESNSNVISDSSTNPYLSNQHPEGDQTPKSNVFIGGDVVLADLNQDQSAANAPSSKASYTAGDAAAGVSFRMTSKLAAGVLFDYTHTDADTDNSGSKTKVDTYSPGLFATYFDHGFYANGLFSFGYNDYKNTRNIPALGSTASSSPSGEQYVTDLDFGYDFHPDKNWIFGPTLGLTYTHLDIDSFTETGAPGADLAVDSQSVDSFRSRLGGHVVFQTNTGDVLLQPNFTAMWQHEYLDNSSGITSSFSGSNSFTINTAAPSRDSALIGVGMTATLSSSMALYLNYIADVGAEDYFAQSVIGGFKARF